MKLTLACIALFVSSVLASAFAIGDDGANRAWEVALMTALVIPAFLSGLAVVPTALLAIVRRGERSLLVWLTLVPGGLATVFVLGELIGHE